MKKVCVITTVHPPYDVRIFYHEAVSLAKRYKVVLLAPAESNSEKSYVEVKGLGLYDNRLKRVSKSQKALRLALEEKADVYHFHDPELIFVGLVLKLLRKKVVYDVHEDLPRDIMTKYWIPRWARGLVSRMAEIGESISSLLFDGIVVTTPNIARRFPKEKTFIVQNFPLVDELSAKDAKQYEARDCVVAYIGRISADRGIKELVQAVNLVSGSIKVNLLLAGSFSPPGFEKEVRKFKGWENITYLGLVSRDQISNLLSEARVGVVTLHPTKSYLDSYPVKLFEYMSAGIPVVASDFPLWRKIVKGANCGILVDPLKPKAIANAITWILKNPAKAKYMGVRGREATSKKYNWDKEEKRLFTFYEKILKE